MTSIEFQQTLKEIEEQMESYGDPDFDREFVFAQLQLVPPAELEEDEIEW